MRAQHSAQWDIGKNQEKSHTALHKGVAGRATGQEVGATPARHTVRYFNLIFFSTTTCAFSAFLRWLNTCFM